MVYSGAWGKLIPEKKQKSKISWHCPFKPLDSVKVIEMYRITTGEHYEVGKFTFYLVLLSALWIRIDPEFNGSFGSWSGLAIRIRGGKNYPTKIEKM